MLERNVSITELVIQSLTSNFQIKMRLNCGASRGALAAQALGAAGAPALRERDHYSMFIFQNLLALMGREDTQGFSFLDRLAALADVELPVKVLQVSFDGCC